MIWATDWGPDAMSMAAAVAVAAAPSSSPSSPSLSPSSSGAVSHSEADPGPIAGLVLLCLLGFAIAYHLRQLAIRGVVRGIHQFGFVVSYACVLAYAASDTLGRPTPVFVQLLGVVTAAWFVAWCYATVVQERFGWCGGRRDAEHDRALEDRSFIPDDL